MQELSCNVRFGHPSFDLQPSSRARLYPPFMMLGYVPRSRSGVEILAESIREFLEAKHHEQPQLGQV